MVNITCTSFGFIIKASRRKKASKCKNLIKNLKYRMIIKANRRNVMMKQLKEDITELLENNQNEDAYARVPQLYKEQHILSAYDQVQSFCDCVLSNIDEVLDGRILSVEVSEAVSSLLFTASRCGELPELQYLRRFFIETLGERFERANVELLPGNSVNSEIKHSLCVKSVSEDEKIQIINEIIREKKQKMEKPI